MVLGFKTPPVAAADKFASPAAAQLAVEAVAVVRLPLGAVIAPLLRLPVPEVKRLWISVNNLMGLVAVAAARPRPVPREAAALRGAFSTAVILAKPLRNTVAWPDIKTRLKRPNAVADVPQNGVPSLGESVALSRRLFWGAAKANNGAVVTAVADGTRPLSVAYGPVRVIPAAGDPFRKEISESIFSAPPPYEMAGDAGDALEIIT